MIVNGEKISITEGTSLIDFLTAEGYVPTHIAVERNGAIIPKAEYESVVLTDEDVIEIVHFVGGGR